MIEKKMQVFSMVDVLVGVLRAAFRLESCHLNIEMEKIQR